MIVKERSGLADGTPAALPNESIHCNANWAGAHPTLSILIPVFKYDSSALIRALNACRGANCVELIVFDDGSRDRDLSDALISSIDCFSGPACIITSEANLGRALGRNRLESIARTDWLLFLDGDMLPDDNDFLMRYLAEIERANDPQMIAGGFSLKQAVATRQTDVHWRQSELSECIPAEIRSKEPGRYVFTSNVLVHKGIMNDIPFDDHFSGWGWEDVEWGLRVAKRFPIRHIENTATHLGLDTAADLIRKYGQSGDNFWRTAELHPEELQNTRLYALAIRLAKLPGRSIIKAMTRWICLLPASIMHVSVRVYALKLYRACVHAGAYNARR